MVALSPDDLGVPLNSNLNWRVPSGDTITSVRTLELDR